MLPQKQALAKSRDFCVSETFVAYRNITTCEFKHKQVWFYVKKDKVVMKEHAPSLHYLDFWQAGNIMRYKLSEKIQLA